MQRHTCRVVGLVPVLIGLLAGHAQGEPLTWAPKELQRGARRSPERVLLPSGCGLTYTLDGNADFLWYDATGGQELLLLDDDTVGVDIPFDFAYFGAIQRTLNICSNGWVSFLDDSSTEYQNERLPEAVPASPDATIAIWWDDLDPEAGGEIWIDSFGTSPNRVFVVEYLNVPQVFGEGTYTFEVVFFESTHIIRFQYLTMIGIRDSSTVAIESLDDLEAYEFAYENAPGMDGRSVEFRPEAPSLGCGGGTPTLTCQTPLAGQSVSGASSIDEVGCNSVPLLAGERVYRFTLNSVTDVRIDVTNTGGRNLWPFLFSRCTRCSCIDGGRPSLRHVLGPGTYYVLVDGPLASDNGSFDIALSACDTLLAGQPERSMVVGDPLGCQASIYLDPWYTGSGVWTHRGWLADVAQDEQVYTLAIDRGTAGELLYTTDGSCTVFPRIASWADASAQKAVITYEAPEARVLITMLGLLDDTTGCCGVRIETTIRNLDSAPHTFEWRTLYDTDFDRPTGSCTGRSRVRAGEVEVGTGPRLTSETDLIPLDVAQCFNPIQMFSADDSPQLVPNAVIQMGIDGQRLDIAELAAYVSPRTGRTTPDVGSPCSIGYSGVYLNGEPTSDCQDDNALVLSWRHPSVPADTESSSVHLFGDGCQLSNCSACQATADIVSSGTRICEGDSRQVLLDAEGSTLIGCAGPPQACSGTNAAFRWYRRLVTEPAPGTLLVGESCPQLLIESLPPMNPAGDYIFRVEISCSDAPTCRASREVQVTIVPEGVPAPIGNTLFGVRSSESAVFSWDGSDILAQTWRLRRDLAPDGATATIIADDLPQPTVQDTDVLLAPDPLYFYWASGRSCTGIEGP